MPIFDVEVRQELWVSNHLELRLMRTAPVKPDAGESAPPRFPDKETQRISWVVSVMLHQSQAMSIAFMKAPSQTLPLILYIFLEI